ncbi:N-acyl-D-amino-acid deacylase family protein [Pseudohalioglobus lutimaris]|uniref:Amidohydrolase n=1 Tax=Pseudohalioglobus lutimaris TaxID=1737061 RepID=A0A2N5X524_9GAMM|nr:amidohydrolase family protein [Pseudohalioglobus lutimaris]PLW69582.1 amidohydrolase [Pseudohalioglobus lutimaris]
MSTYDMVVRGGTVVDGSGGESTRADIGIKDGLIAAIGVGLDGGKEEIDARGHLVTPGFVDVHTHYDGHVTWENRLSPSSHHGVTTVVMGNCGVGFAPCKPDDHEALIRLMDGVEDIPFPVLAEGLPWTWESFPEYMDVVASREFDMDVAAYLPHAALRVYVMGARGVNREPATAADLARMCQLLGEALDAGAIGIATSRTLFHRSSDGRPIPTLDANSEELQALAGVLREKGKGVFQIVEDLHEPGRNFSELVAIARVSGRPLTFTLGSGNDGPFHWPELLEELDCANAEGVVIKGQVLPRAIGVMLGHELTLNPFYTTATYQALQELPLSERLIKLREPRVRAQILSEPPDPDPALVLGRSVRNFDYMFVLGDPPDYEQPWELSIAGRAKARGIKPEELAYDLLLEGERGSCFYLAMGNYANGNLDAVSTMLNHPHVVPGLGDGGAHAATICDGSYSTFALTHWARDRQRDSFSVENIVKRLTSSTARLMGLTDRGLLEVGKKADINVIDFEGLSLHAPEIRYDLPGNGCRLTQRATGYVATLVSGVPVYRHGEATGALPGRLVRP